jgi:hypothetical protein
MGNNNNNNKKKNVIIRVESIEPVLLIMGEIKINFY